MSDSYSLSKNKVNEVSLNSKNISFTMTKKFTNNVVLLVKKNKIIYYECDIESNDNNEIIRIIHRINTISRLILRNTYINQILDKILPFEKKTYEYESFKKIIFRFIGNKKEDVELF